MAQNKKILLSLSETLVEEVDALAAKSGISRTDFIRTATAAYVAQEHKRLLREQLKEGYTQMGSINLALAEMCFEADTAAWEKSEEKLSECE